MATGGVLTGTIATDRLYLNYPFKVTVYRGGISESNIVFSGNFSSVNIPEITYDVVEYRAGDAAQYRNRPLGLPTFNEVSVQRGKLAKSGNSEGDNNKLGEIISNNNKLSGHRYIVVIEHYHPNEKTVIKLYNAVISRIKVDGDLDSMSSDVSLVEIDFTYEYFTIETASGEAFGDWLGWTAS
jgi:hypothetical protein